MKLLFQKANEADKTFLQSLKRGHLEYKDRAVNLFRNTRKMGTQEFSRGYEDELVAGIEELYKTLELDWV